MFPSEIYVGTIDKPAAARKANHGWPNPTTSSRTTNRVSELNDEYSAPVTTPFRDPSKAPAIPAKNAEIQKTMSFVSCTLAPWVSRPNGDSDKAFRSRPNRLASTTEMRRTDRTKKIRIR